MPIIRCGRSHSCSSARRRKSLVVVTGHCHEGSSAASDVPAIWFGTTVRVTPRSYPCRSIDLWRDIRRRTDLQRRRRTNRFVDGHLDRRGRKNLVFSHILGGRLWSKTQGRQSRRRYSDDSPIRRSPQLQRRDHRLDAILPWRCPKHATSFFVRTRDHMDRHMQERSGRRTP